MAGRITVVLLAFMLLPSCSETEEQVANAIENRHEAEGSKLAKLPHINRRGRQYPFVRYAETTGQANSRGQIFYLYPTTKVRNQIIALEHDPSATVNGITVEEILGSVGLITSGGQMTTVDFLPISLPRNFLGQQTWQMRYIDRDFTCSSNASPAPMSVSARIKVSCSAGSYVLRFSFERERGITEYQDFCDRSICTYRLVDHVGLLSRATLIHMGLPSV